MRVSSINVTNIFLSEIQKISSIPDEVIIALLCILGRRIRYKFIRHFAFHCQLNLLVGVYCFRKYSFIIEE